MKRLFYILVMNFCVATFCMGQVSCEPDEFYADSVGGVYPRPVSEAFPDAGIDLPACPGQDYYFNLTINVPDTILFGDFTLEVVRVRLRTDDPVKGLPDGLTFVCNPSNCDMPAGTLGCVAVTGTVSADVDPGIYPLEILVEIVTGVGIPIPTQFPNEAIAPGEYFIVVEEPNEDGECLSVSVHELTSVQKLSIFPNPTDGGSFNIQIPDNIQNENIVVNIYDLSGKPVYSNNFLAQEKLTIENGQLASGIYTVMLKSNASSFVGKLVVQK